MSLLQKFPWAVYLSLLALLLLLMFAPVSSVVLAGTVANAYGCQVDEGSAPSLCESRGRIAASFFTPFSSWDG